MRVTFPDAGVLRPRFRLTPWDLVVVPLVIVAILLLTVAFQGASQPFDETTPDLIVSLNPANLPYYGLRTVFRMFLAVLLSLLFTFTVATLAARSRRAEIVIIPVLDFLQSLPILGFLTVTTAIFLGMFRGSLLGLEAASIFAIFTSQVWNMAFSFYHSLITTPRELREAAAVLRLSPWKKFWKLEVPFAMPGLIWNTMMSVSGGWFFVVASEVISVVGRDNDQYLPGVGSYIALAIEQADITAMVYAGLTLLMIILIYDQLIFRPIVAWSEKFKFEQSEAQEVAQSWMLRLLQRSGIASSLGTLGTAIRQSIPVRPAGDHPGPRVEPQPSPRPIDRAIDRIWYALVIAAALWAVWFLATYMFGPGLGFDNGRVLAANPNVNTDLNPEIARRFAAVGVTVNPDHTVWLSDVCAATAGGTRVSAEMAEVLRDERVGAPGDLAAACATPMVPAGKVSWSEVLECLWLGLLTTMRVIIWIGISTLVWTPIGVWIGLRPRVAQFVQPLAQFAAAFPANLLFPIAVVLISTYALPQNLFQAPLMILGAQWYILFNVIAGTSSIPNDLKEAARVLGLRGWAWWRKLIIPAIFPAFVTGGITASGGSWNASIVSEVVSWGATTLTLTGLGAYIAYWSTGEFNPHVGLGMLVMGMLVLAFNRLFWRRLYALAETRFRLD
ncbi:MAG: ABC transporter permease subunit [Roseiflexus sp.]|uniref:ABC transporter permease n=1 Tax=Roseiflexus sp. TaxID=2562120 RepID=UPI0025E63729|nr:ABC transporter permease subunit [Roseiflexus sp.]MCL6540826.1 ABC transporter permease subunit [Roseiflexus sp.]